MNVTQEFRTVQHEFFIKTLIAKKKNAHKNLTGLNRNAINKNG